MNEETLLKEIQSDPRKFGDVYEAFYQNIFGYAFRRTTSYDAAKDIAAETFLKAFGGIHRFIWRDISVLHWLYRIATNEINRYYRHKRYAPESLERVQEEYGVQLTDFATAESERLALDDELSRHREFVRMHGAVRLLDKKYQDVIALRYYEQRSLKDIAAILGKKEGTIKSLHSRGLELLRKRLKEPDHEER